MTSLGDTARWLGVTDRELARLIESGQIRVVLPSIEIRIHAADLDAYLERQGQRPRRRFASWMRRSA